MAQVLLVSRDAAVVADVRRAGAVLGVEVDVQDDATAVAARWRAAAAVVVDAPHAGVLPLSALPRREHVVVVAAARTDLSAWRCAAAVGSDAVLALPDDERALIDRLLLATDDTGPPGRVLGVRPGAGGAGASTLAAALAVAAARDGAAVTLVDMDPAAGGLDLLLGAEHLPGVRWPDLAEVRGAVPAASVRDALLHAGGIRLLSCARRGDGGPLPASAAAVLPALRRGQDLVVVDLPRVADEASAVAATFCEAVALVVPADVRSTAAAAGLVGTARARGMTPHLVVRRGAGRRLQPREVGAALGLPVTAVIETDAEIAAAADRGQLDRVTSRGSLASAVAALRGALTEQRAAG